MCYKLDVLARITEILVVTDLLAKRFIVLLLLDLRFAFFETGNHFSRVVSEKLENFVSFNLFSSFYSTFGFSSSCAKVNDTMKDFHLSTKTQVRLTEK